MIRLLRCFSAVVLVFLLTAPQGLWAQGVGFGDWQLHLPTSQARILADAGRRIYVVADNSFYYFDKETTTTTLLSRRDDLNGVGVRSIAYDSVSQQLLVAYQDANLDLLSPDAGRIRNISDIQRKQLSGTKNINNIHFNGTRAYLSCDFGILVLDMNRLEVRDTYSNIGPLGVNVKVYATVVSGGLIFAATDKGLQHARLTANLADYRAWTLDIPGSDGSFTTLAVHKGQVYAGRNFGNILRYRSGSIWDALNTYSERYWSLVSTPAGLLFTNGTLIALVTVPANTVTVLQSPSIPSPVHALRARDGAIYVADLQRGLLRTTDRQNYERFMSNAPETAQAFGLSADARSNTVTVYTGAFDLAYTQQERRFGFYDYQAGRWTNYTQQNYPSPTQYPNIKDITRGARTPDGTLYVGSYGDGLLRWKGPGDFTLYTPANSPLISAIPGQPYTRVTDVAVATNGDVWVATRHPEQAGRSGLHVLTPGTETWRTIPFYAGFDNPDRLVLDDFGAVWASQARKGGSGLMAYDDVNKTPPLYFSAANGLPSNTVYALAKDRKGAIWVTTDKGIAVLDDPGSAFTGGQASFTTPILDRFPALNEEVVRAVAVDGANRKWFGTDRGLWLLNEDGTAVVHHFTTSNSPLPSNQIQDVAVNDKTGEVFVATPAGVAAYKGSATVTEGTPRCAKVTPNPVRTNFMGQVGVSGLANNGIVKITDVTGKLVYQTTATGGTVVWNLADYNGRKVQSGVYLVLSTDAEGKNGCVSKIAVVEQ
ncbi:type IX secretion system anionic LPS delivery protein PorZ [Hymenobacter psychrotolerans]|uniref:Por secretion system C-terminal sorting domain-containing protein n=1 Tax=Hymenobacter psychrotolerans DSM 18569 TaxID=1121959 RepID=A0A1M6YP27_9BACT|nr:two-component regulator propeller domain-containing protein [Hymenobacter psychrotolerans]SHL19900.1 Por secretion system C-terminal sorting domain-containing protein [Hymenobacter psychrotolerans DSM 18569]